MRRELLIGLLALAVLAAGCGGSDSDSGAAAGGGETVRVAEVGGDRVLVDDGGAALYTADQEADGTIRCTGDCLSFWLPLSAPASGEPTAADGVDGELGVIERDDGTRQVTLDGKPVYRFSEDAPGQVTGDGLEDDFGGTTFTWRVLAAGDDDDSGGSAPGGYSY
jgi:predicted lipoprotein with Yx(FWY)xxD motif